jgi:hypothetical protein
MNRIIMSWAAAAAVLIGVAATVPADARSQVRRLD